MALTSARTLARRSSFIFSCSSKLEGSPSRGSSLLSTNSSTAVIKGNKSEGISKFMEILKMVTKGQRSFHHQRSARTRSCSDSLDQEDTLKVHRDRITRQNDAWAFSY